MRASAIRSITRLCAFTVTAVSLMALATAPWIRQAASSFCRDCTQTTVVLKRREGDVVRTYVASWDTSQPVTAELRELRRLVLELQMDSGVR